MTQAQDPFFKSIGSLAEQTDQLPDDDAPSQSQSGVLKEGGEEGDERPLQEIESLCMACGKQGVTRLMLTSIPYFRQVIVMSFQCEHCGNRNNEVQSAGEIREQGSTYTAKILEKKDLDRQLVKSATCTVIIPEFELTIPAHRGQLTNVEGLIRDTVLDLRRDQPLRRIQDEETWNKIEVLLGKLKEIIGFDDDDEEKSDDGQAPEDVKEKKEGEVVRPFTIKLDDPAGNSWIEWIDSMADPKWSVRQYNRTREQNVALGLVQEDGEEHSKVVIKPEELLAKKLEADDDDGPAEEIYVFPGICSSCSAPLNTMMKKVIIPYFKDILIMSTNCDACGYRDNEVKSGSAISEKGKKITLKVEDAEDLARDILKSETCGLEIPEIELSLQHGTLGGRFTTLEGILNQVYDELNEKAFAMGDAGEADEGRQSFKMFLAKLKKVMTAEIPFTLILDDPLANSYLQNIYAPDPDPNMTTELYERTFEQNEELGLNDMKVEGYGSGDEEDAEVLAVANAVNGAKLGDS